MPKNPRLSDFRWSPNEHMVAFLNTTKTGVEVWVLNITESNVTKVSGKNINANMGNTLHWFKDSEHLLIKTLPHSRKALINKGAVVPNGPTISMSDGAKAQNRTYQDLLKHLMMNLILNN